MHYSGVDNDKDCSYVVVLSEEDKEELMADVMCSSCLAPMQLALEKVMGQGKKADVWRLSLKWQQESVLSGLVSFTFTVGRRDY